MNLLPHLELKRSNVSCFKNESNLRSEKYIIIGDPVPLARPRFCKGHVFDSQKMNKMVASNSIMYQHKNRLHFTGPLHLQVTFFMALPRCSKKKQELLLGTFHKARPDFSNLLKFIEDVAQDVLYDDDCIISSVCGSKIYDRQPRTELILTEIV